MDRQKNSPARMALGGTAINANVNVIELPIIALSERSGVMIFVAAGVKTVQLMSVHKWTWELM